jgi:very-short-patch-repair endonuclease
LDGGQHNNDYGKTYDLERTRFLSSLKIKVIRFWDNDVLQKTDEVVEEILKQLEQM